MDKYKLYVSDVSYYSGKLEAYLRYKGIDHERIEINTNIMRETILPATGFMKIPAMQCADGRWLKDTTPMMQWLDQQHSRFPIYPEDPVTRFLALLLEDYADEWMWRPAMYYRWRFSDSHALLRKRLGRGLSAGTMYSERLTGWYMRWRQYLVFVRGDGVRPHNEAQIQTLYHQTLNQLTAILKNQRFLSGTKPGIVDFGFFASMFRHFALDPYSARIMVDTAPAVYAWVARLWNARGENEGRGTFDDFSATHWDPLFSLIEKQYLPYLDRNAEAYAVGSKRFDLVLGNTLYPKMPVVRYRAACRSQLIAAYRGLSPSDQARVQSRFGQQGIGQWFATARPIDSGLDAEFKMPLEHRYPPARGLYGLRLFKGTPWDIPSGPLK